uniref:U2A'/phosphoprotein 32 family A C-terminal domain-containing protein n=1 Tax=Tetradesmus obliquus TaxID=3088 RepID=A0A383VDS6_TETOB|eukprot:jgi/Sobl393_1/4423/SZX63697.1
MVQLTQAIIKGKTRLDKLSEVKNLNLWGQDITDVSILQHTPAVQVLSLSVNGISSLRDFMHCRELRELYLRKNNVANLNDIRFLMPLPHLKVLWLSDNPCAELPHYRQVVVANLPGLEKLDNVEVTPADRQAAQGTPLLQAATYAELEQLMEGWELDQQAGGVGSLLQQQQQQPRTVTPGPVLQQAPRMQLAGAAAGEAARGEAVGSGARSAVAGQAAAGTDSYGSGVTIGITVPGRPSSFVAAADAGAGGSAAAGYGLGAALPELYPHHQQQQEQYNPQRYSSQPGSQAAQVPSYQSRAPAPADYAQAQQAFAAGLLYQQSSSGAPARSRSPVGGSSNVLYAVIALLADLDTSQLGIVQKEVEQRLAALRLA